ncbi:MAG: SAM-dependent methyltransferase [Wenzhouxiangellaceae bacterium]|nr:SAM-dependent methyltransferase [Wenzhouxiangellaceae bacterium]
MRDPSLSLPDPPRELAELSRELCTTLVEAIESGGPMPFSEFMERALYAPGLGYYVNGLHKFGAAGDFVTAPEQGTLFAASLARALDPVTDSLGPGWTLLEAGPGSGALARDLLAQLERPPGRCLLLERSAALREVQHETLAELPGGLRERIEWIDAPPGRPFDGVVLANEVLDALPVARFRMTDRGPRELAVTVENGRFAWTTWKAGDRLAAALDHVLGDLPHDLPVGYESEVCPDLPGWVDAVCAPLRRGCAMFVDYGYPRREYYLPERSGGTLVCHYRHRAHFDPFAWPGLTDLSAFVDFTALAEAGLAAGLELDGFTTQAGLVLGSGVAERLEGGMPDDRRLRLAGELKRLVLPGEMGEKFKAMAFRRGDASAPDGFALPDLSGRL